MTRFFKFFLLSTAAVFVSAIFSSCTDEPEIQPEKERLILIYAIAANSLEYNLTKDTLEIKSVAANLNLDKNKVLLYSVDYSNECKLFELRKKSNNNYGFAEIKKYPELPLSTSPERIEEVISDVVDKYDYPDKGLVLWSHATGWIPSFTGSTPSRVKQKSFGEDKYDGTSYRTNINELADAIPSGVFDFIWFDCCYMANIETIYQLRDKAPYIVGSVIEIGANGMPYNLTMPYLMRKDADLVTAAKIFFDSYEDIGLPVSISVVKTDELPALAELTRNIFTNYKLGDNLSAVQNYCILYENGKRQYFYDFEQLLNTYQDIPEELKFKIKAKLNDAIIYKNISDYNWTNRYVTSPEKIDVARFSGLSMHNFQNTGSTSEDFYMKLDWFKATR